MNTEIIAKSARVSGQAVDGSELELINKYTLEPLAAEQVFAFKIAMCDNEIDRDFEAFPTETLNKLALMFAGRTVIKDHRSTADNQCARIYYTEVAAGEGQSKTGEQYARLIARCYMVRTDGNADLIKEIQAGIKKEVSVSCAIGSCICSICGADNRRTYCQHLNGREYDGKICYFRLTDPKDAYEVSFVAVPAQPAAGVTKSYLQPDAGGTNQNAQKDLIDSELGIVGSFIFTENERMKEK